MGFLKKIFFSLLLILIINFCGCAPSLIKVKTLPDLPAYPMFGKTSSKTFYVFRSLKDTLTKKWENGVNGGFANSSVTVYGNYVFAADLSGRVFCFDNRTGKKAGRLKNKGAIFSAPIIDKTNIVFAVADENSNVTNLISYNFTEGKEKFNKEIKGKVTTEIIKDTNGVIFNTDDGRLYKYTFYGEESWKYESKEFIHSSPALYNDIVLFGNDKGEIIAVNSTKGKLIYKKKISEPFFCGACIDSGIAFIGNDDGKLYAIEIKSGNIKWEFKTGARITMVPAVRDDEIIIGNLNGDLYKINKSDGKEIWKTSTGGLLNATPLISENFILLPDNNKKFYFVDYQTGKINKTYELDGRVKLSPVIADSTLFIGYENGNICAYKL
jgi:eukaryotic-like serine/threonine-protein kinase